MLNVELTQPLVGNLPHDHEKKTIEKPFPKRLIKILGILQIICGILVIVLQVCVTKMIPKIVIKFVILIF